MTSPALTSAAHRACLFVPISETSNSTDQILVYLDGKDVAGFDKDVKDSTNGNSATVTPVPGFGDRAVIADVTYEGSQTTTGEPLHIRRLIASFDGQYFSVTSSNLGDKWRQPSVDDLEQIIQAARMHPSGS